MGIDTNIPDKWCQHLLYYKMWNIAVYNRLCYNYNEREQDQSFVKIIINYTVNWLLQSGEIAPQKNYFKILSGLFTTFKKATNFKYEFSLSLQMAYDGARVVIKIQLNNIYLARDIVGLSSTTSNWTRLSRKTLSC